MGQNTLLLNSLITAEHSGERGAIVSVLASLFLQGFKGEPGEDGLVVSIAGERSCVRAPRPPRFTSPFSSLQ